MQQIAKEIERVWDAIESDLHGQRWEAAGALLFTSAYRTAALLHQTLPSLGKPLDLVALSMLFSDLGALFSSLAQVTAALYQSRSVSTGATSSTGPEAKTNSQAYLPGLEPPLMAAKPPREEAP